MTIRLRTTRRLLAAAGLLLGGVSLASAADYPKIIQMAINSGLTVEKHFSAASGMTGWVMKHQGQYSIMYTTPDNKTLITGPLIDESGSNLTLQYADKYIPRPDFSALMKELESGTYITEGTVAKPKSVLYVFTDANCPYCHLTWKALQAYEKAGLQVRWVPVAILRDTSLNKAVAILAAKDRTAAFRDDMVNFRNGGTKASADLKQHADLVAVIKKNSELMERFGINGTPGIVWAGADGKVNAKAGVPNLAALPEITGLPEQPITDPELARFRQ